VADIDVLRQQALDVITDATDYLTRRESSAVVDMVERAGIREHTLWLSQASQVIATVDFKDTENESSIERFVQYLNLSKAQIESLHEYSPYTVVDQSLRILDQHLRMFVGTHGPGGGNPIGWPR
jgi:hypothetical protein